MSFALFAAIASVSGTSEAVPCKQACGPSELCSPKGECVSRCNPVCASNELCAPDGGCVSACNPACADNEVCSGEKTCVSRCNPTCTGGATCRADGACEATPASAAPALPATRPLAVESNGGGGRHPNWALFGVGTGVFVVGWLATGIITTVVCNNVGCQNSEAALSFVPVFGPPSILALSADGMEAGQIAGLLVGETVQLTGIVLSIVGLVTTVESNAARNQSPLRMGELPFVVTPVTGSGFTGFSAVGQF